MKPYIIIGNGVAAAGCIEGIRQVDAHTPITVISEENRPVYCRPLISYYLEGKTAPERMDYRDPAFYDRMDCRVLYGRRAVALDPASNTVTLDDGAVLPYSSVCVAAGSAPFVPPFQGLDTVEQAYGFMTMDDALALEAAINPTSRVLIVGAGLIGLKCAEGLHGRVGSITVCDLADRVLSSILDADCARPVQQRLAENGITFLPGRTVARFAGHTAVLTDGEELPFDVLVLAVGVRANTALIKEAGGGTDRGILVDDRMATTLPGVYAAGDCTQGNDISCGQKRVLALLPNAYMQGHTAGVNMAGGEAVFDKAIPMNAIGFFGLHALTAGSYDGTLYEEKTDGALKRFFVREGRLVGFILIGDTARAGIYTALIRERTPLDTLNFNLLRKVATTAAFSPETRSQKFGGVV